ncbi:BLUF domain-containing protein [Brevundimonas intermedia]|uniref:BLUF domain-containing protein n=1 Tax=Brevundimonas intermedia TaxID=74315 RepID=A0A4Y9S513_9CAUL|nr:BLUF domain-containing protein [Brevundimonas intermedia]TFW14608.1 BLUF domain-containing protein [Brevundimonas intermedia]
MLYRIVFVSEMIGASGRDVQSVAEILGVSERNNLRDEISSAMMFHDGEAAQVAEGARADLDRLLTRLSNDPRHRNLRILEDRPVMQRRMRDSARLCALNDAQAQDILYGRRLSDLSSTGLEKLLSCEHVKMAA